MCASTKKALATPGYWSRVTQHRCDLDLCLGARFQCQLCVDKGGLFASSAEGVESRRELGRKLSW